MYLENKNNFKNIKAFGISFLYMERNWEYTKGFQFMIENSYFLNLI